MSKDTHTRPEGPQKPAQTSQRAKLESIATQLACGGCGLCSTCVGDLPFAPPREARTTHTERIDEMLKERKVPARCYLAGPITRRQETAPERFRQAEKKAARHWPECEFVNPLHLEADRTRDSADLRYWMSICLPALLECDAVLALDGWRLSRGARLEIAVAISCKIPLFQHEYRPATRPPALVPAWTLERLDVTPEGGRR